MVMFEQKASLMPCFILSDVRFWTAKVLRTR